ncbi:MAG: HIT domain-containing protein [Patescibacteria group bacterium]|nr:HIT domain-containing protein [Patescibacteria group bacterium]
MYNHEPKGYVCPFCRFVEGHESDYNKITDIIYQDESTFAYISPKWWINNPGNVIIIPKTHVEHIYDIGDELLAKIYCTGKKIAIAMKKSYGCDGTLFRQHNEPSGNQEMYHFHLHLFPRWEEDRFYQNLENCRYVTASERLPFAEKLRLALQESS